LKAVNDALAVRESVGRGATPHLLLLKAQLEEALGLHKPPPEPVEPEPVSDPVVEHAAAEELPEAAVPRRPGRPRKDDLTGS